MKLQLTIVTAGLALLLAAGGRAAGPRFFSDDPIARDPETQDASGVTPIPVSEQFDFVENSFLKAGERVDLRAVNINTIDQVPDSHWFTNRAGSRPLTIEELVRGPNTGSGPADGPWTIVGSKTEGVTPGMTIRDSTGVTYIVKFDPPSNPEMASGAEVIATKFFHAMGYHVPENYIARVRPASLVIGAGTTTRDEDGRERPMRQRDVDALLARAAQHPDGSYRVLASRRLDGVDVGRFRFYGTRPDDPNDIFLHEHRRELRGLSVFAAWLNHDDSRSVNTLDMLVPDGPRRVIRHHLIDFGSALGSGSTQAQTTRAGNEYIWDARPTFITMLTLGLYVRPWVKVDYTEYPAIGRFESTYFTPAAWKPEYPNAAFRNARPDDQFWAAHIVSAFSEEAVRAVVGTAAYSDARAAEYLVETLLARKSKVLVAWLNGVNPIVNPVLSASGTLTFDNAAEEAGVSKQADSYSVTWARFDNATGSRDTVGDAQSVTAKQARMPDALRSAAPDYLAVSISAVKDDQPAWRQPVHLYFRRAAAGWTLVGLERQP